MLPAHVSVRLAKAIQDVEAVLVGGQAVNLWAEIFSSSVPELEQFGPFTSKDVDFFGSRRAAVALAKAIGGEASYPTIDDHTPNTAMVTAVVDGYKVSIDFLSHVLGTGPGGMAAVQVQVIVREGNEVDSFTLKIMHPVHCLFSRVNTIMHPAIQRRDGFAMRQINATYYIVRKYIDECLVSGLGTDRKEAFRCFSMIHDFLLRDHLGRVCHQMTPIDPLGILDSFVTDDRIDARYRTYTLSRMINRIGTKRVTRTRGCR